MIHSFNFSLNRPINAGLVTFGKFDGKHPSIACATAGDAIIVHSPHKRDESMEHEVRELSINKKITALSSGDMKIDKPEFSKVDLLLVGTSAHCMAFNVEDNRDVFYQDIPDGVTAITYGMIPGQTLPLAIVGGNCSIQGFDHDGTELFWTVTGENVSAFAMRQRKNVSELLAASEDLHIRVFHAEEVVSEINEADVCTTLTAIDGLPDSFGYGLKNSTFGVYNDQTKTWSAKGKATINDITSFDLDSDGVSELICGWSDGRFEVRNIESGKVVYKDRLDGSVAKIVHGNYRLKEQEQVIACSIQGDLRGYVAATEERKGNLMDQDLNAEAVKELQATRQNLLAELAMFEDNQKGIKSGESSADAVPTDTRLLMSVTPNNDAKALSLVLKTNNDVLMRLGVVFADGMYDEESHVVCPSQPSKTLQILLKPRKHIKTDLNIRAVVGYMSSTQDHVFDMKMTLPRFSSFYYVATSKKILKPKASVRFVTTERANRVLLWIAQAFTFDQLEKRSLPQNPSLPYKIQFLNVQNDQSLVFNIGTGENKTNAVEIQCDDLELAGDIIQDLLSYLQIDVMESTAHFPHEMDEFRTVLEEVVEFNAERSSLTAAIADRTQLVKTYIIKAEDARTLGDISTMNQIYAQLYNLNLELLGEFKKRANNREQLSQRLKDVNAMIQKASRLRMGTAKQKVVALFRKAILANNADDIVSIIRTGSVQVV